MPLSDALPEAPGALGTVRNAALLLRLLAQGPAYHQLTDLADRSGLSLATVHRLLRSLVLAEIVEQDPRSARYGLGPELTRLSHRYLARSPVVGALAPYLAQLRHDIGTTVRVQMLVGTSLVTVDRVDGEDAGVYRDAFDLRPGLRTAAGRLIGARCEDERWKQLLADVDEPLRDLAERERHVWSQATWLHVDGPEGRAGEVAVAATDADGNVLAALTASVDAGAGPERVRDVVALLSRTTTVAARVLGGA
ncbi:MAG: helix-turn-helix domain-containing protein [Dermatophilaceae bacterium]